MDVRIWSVNRCALWAGEIKGRNQVNGQDRNEDDEGEDGDEGKDEETTWEVILLGHCNWEHNQICLHQHSPFSIETEEGMMGDIKKKKKTKRKPPTSNFQSISVLQSPLSV